MKCFGCLFLSSIFLMPFFKKISQVAAHRPLTTWFWEIRSYVTCLYISSYFLPLKVSLDYVCLCSLYLSASPINNKIKNSKKHLKFKNKKFLFFKNKKSFNIIKHFLLTYLFQCFRIVFFIVFLKQLKSNNEKAYR